MQNISKTHYAQMHENAKLHNAFVKKTTKSLVFAGFLMLKKLA